jgi:hypothetical protein
MQKNGNHSALLLGVEGPRAEAYLETLDEAFRFSAGRLDGVSSPNPEHVGELLSDILPSTPQSFQNIRVSNLGDVKESSRAKVVYSALTGETAQQFERPMSEGRVVITGSASGINGGDAMLANPYFSAGRIVEYLNSDRRSKIINVGSNLGVLLATTLAPLKVIGMDSVNVTAYTGKDDHHGFQPAKSDLVDQPRRLLSPHQDPLGIAISAPKIRLANWKGYNFLRAEVALFGDTSLDEIEDLYVDAESSGCLRRFNPSKLLPKSHPVELTDVPIITSSGSIPRLESEPDPMSALVYIEEFDQSAPNMLVVQAAGKKEYLGGAGSGVMTGLFAQVRELI